MIFRGNRVHGDRDPVDGQGEAARDTLIGFATYIDSPFVESVTGSKHFGPRVVQTTRTSLISLKPCP